MEDIKIRELPEKASVNTSNHVIVEDEDGTKKVLVNHLRSLLVSSLYFNTVEEMKNSDSVSLKEGDICETLGYHTPGDGGRAKYLITYNPGAIEDGGLVHYLSYSDVLRAEIILENSINVHQFGAVGDGNTDDTAAIQAAVNNSDYRVIEFSNNKTYIIRKAIELNKSNTLINGNGAVIVPYYVNGINITPTDDNMITDITINKLHFDCSRSITAIDIYKASKVDIISCKISNVTNTGINIKNSEFVNISYCELDGQNGGSLISLDGDNNDIPVVYSRFINILDCYFNNFSKAIHILSTGTDGEINTLVNLNNCNYHSLVNNSYCIYVACPIEMLSIYANTVTAANTFLYFGGASKGDIACRSISCLNTAKVFDIGTPQGVLHLDGSIKVSNDTVLFENMNGKLKTNVSWDLLPNGSSFNNKPIGEIYDSIHPYNYNDARGYSTFGSKLTLHEVRNLNVDWSGTSNITEIENGINGQLIYLKSSSNKSIIASSNKIVLSDSSIELGLYKGILLKFDGLKWVQIQYKDSTIMQTVSREIENVTKEVQNTVKNLEIDYSKLQFDTSVLIPAE